MISQQWASRKVEDISLALNDHYYINGTFPIAFTGNPDRCYPLVVSSPSHRSGSTATVILSIPTILNDAGTEWLANTWNTGYTVGIMNLQSPIIRWATVKSIAVGY